jgi:ribosome-associated protein
MLKSDLINRNFGKELIYSASRSSGPGGQNVNKLNTKVELRICITATTLFTDLEKEIILLKLKKKINKDGELVLVSQGGRTQSDNKNLVTEKFYEVVSRVLTLPEIRKATRPTYSSKIKRLDEKKIRSSVKKLRKPGKTEDES